MHAAVAGVVSAVGHEVTRFQPGEEVFGTGQGTFAEYARAPESKLAPKPANLTFEQAAVVALSGQTALQGLREYGRIQPGQKVLITGASGGVGTFAMQLAKAFLPRRRLERPVAFSLRKLAVPGGLRRRRRASHPSGSRASRLIGRTRCVAAATNVSTHPGDMR